MADALRHAHDRGVLHRDLKPSNILIAADGTPMLLDFNLARELGVPTAADPLLGGTLAYMAPEHLGALLAGRDEGVDHRADLYALGLILVEMLGTGPLDPAERTASPGRLLARRRQGPPPLPAGPRRLPGGLVAVLRRCLAPEPADRYASAGDLAADLRAVADDAPLAFSREPWPARSGRWLRQNRVAVLGAGLVGLAILGALGAWSRARSDRLARAGEVDRYFRDGLRDAELGEYRLAASHFALAADRARGYPELAEVSRAAGGRRAAVEAAGAARDAAARFFGQAEAIRFALLGFVGDQGVASRDLAAAFEPLGVLTEPDWIAGRLVRALDPDRRARLIREVDDLLFLWVVAAARGTAGAGPASASRRDQAPAALACCREALGFTAERDAWLALRAWWQAQADGGPDSAPPELPGPARAPGSAAACFRWALLAPAGSGAALDWFAAAARGEPANYWHQFALAYEAAARGDQATARAHYDVAIALRADVPWAWKNRAMLAARQGDWAGALDDLARALAACRAPGDEARVRLERGRTRQRLGDFPAAHADYAGVEAADPAGLARDARRDRARLEADAGATGRALALYDALLAADPGDWPSRLGRAILALRLGDLGAATRDLDRIIAAGPQPYQAAALGHRAATRLARGDPAAARADATAGAALQPSPRFDRLLLRCKLALGDDLGDELDLDLGPGAFDDLPPAASPLAADLGRRADRLAGRIEGEAGAGRARLRRDRATLLAAAGDWERARAEVDRLVAEAPGSPGTWLVRGQVERRAGRADAAGAAVAAGLALAPEHPGLTELRGLIAVDEGRFAPGLADLVVAYTRGAVSARGAAMAEALMHLGRPAESAELWDRLLAADPQDLRARLGLAQARRQLGEWDRALASLEEAAGSVGDRSPLLGRLVVSYASCLPARPDRLPRVLTLGRAWLASWRPRRVARARWADLPITAGPGGPVWGR